jgi:hypothetical protein
VYPLIRSFYQGKLFSQNQQLAHIVSGLIAHLIHRYDPTIGKNQNPVDWKAISIEVGL